MLKVLRDKRFARLWAGQTISFFGDWLNIAAVISLLAFKWHVDPLTLSLFGLCASIPWLVLGPVAGVLADRWNRKTTMIITDIIRAAAVLGYIAAAEVWHVYAVAFTLSTAGVFFAPSRTAVIRQIVPEGDLLAANSLSSFTLQATKIIGPAVGGAIVAAAGEHVCFWANSASFLASALVILTVALPDHRLGDPDHRLGDPDHAGQAPVGKVAARRSFAGDFLAGLAHIRATSAILYTVVLLSLCNLCVGLFDSVSGVFIRENFGTDPKTMGLLIAAVGVGSAFSTVWIGSRGKAFSRPALSALGALWMGLALGLMIACSVFGGALAGAGTVFFAMLVGAGVFLVSIPALTTIQVETPPGMMGRVGGTIDSLLAGVSIVAFPLGGLLATAFGATRSTMGAAVLLTVVGITALLKMPGVRPFRVTVAAVGVGPPVSAEATPDSPAAG